MRAIGTRPSTTQAARNGSNDLEINPFDGSDVTRLLANLRASAMCWDVMSFLDIRVLPNVI